MVPDEEMRPYDLTCEYAKRPLAVDVPHPRFGWKLEGDGGEYFQTEYRIRVATSPEGLENPDVWDSGNVSSRKSLGIVCEAKLSPRTEYFWQVVSDGVPSETARFETAPAESDWWGRWIGMPMNYSGNTLLTRTSIEVPEGRTVRRARAYVAGLGCHEAFLNGEQLGAEKLNPSVTVYEKRVFYNVYELNLKHGWNVFGLELGYGWYGSRQAFGQIFVDFTDGSVLHACTQSGEGWWMTAGAVLSNSIYGGEVCDARRAIENWCTSDYQPGWDMGWMYAVGVPGPSGKLCPQRMEGMAIVERYPETGRKEIDGVTVVSLEQNISGWARIEVRGEPGAKVTLRYGERPDGRGRVNRINLRSAAAEDTYILRGIGTETWAPRFTYHGFQYVEVSVEGRVELLSLTGEHLRNALPACGSFECSDETLNRLHRIAAATESNNLLGVMTDCPQRDERFGWLNDLTSRIFQSVNNFDLKRFLPDFIRDVTDAQGSEGDIADTVPHFVGGRPADPVSGYIILGLFDWMRYGDRDCLAENFEGFCAWFQYMERYLEGDVLNFGIYGDWVPAAPFTKDGGACPFSGQVSVEYVSAAYYVWYARMLARISEALEKSERIHYQHRAAELKSAFDKKYFDSVRRIYGTGGQTELAIALTLTEDVNLAGELAEKMAADLCARGYHTTCGNQGYRHLFEHLGRFGYASDGVKLLKNPEYPGWGFMLAQGATTVWERWEEDMKNLMHSYNHPMFASYDAFLYAHVAGLSVKNEAAGCDQFLISPKFPEGIAFAKAALETVRGRASVCWTVTGDELLLSAEIPANTEAEFVLPSEWIGGKTDRKNGSITLRASRISCIN